MQAQNHTYLLYGVTSLGKKKVFMTVIYSLCLQNLRINLCAFL